MIISKCTCLSQAYSSPNGDLSSSSSVSSHHSGASTASSAPVQYSAGMSIWDYIHMYHNKSPVFYNFVYDPQESDPVLRPYCNISNLTVC